MAKIGIDIQTNFDEAGKELKAFTNLTKAETDRINASLKRLEGFEADSFVQKNKRIALSVGATRGSAAALATEARGLEREIQRLIRSGMAPQNESLKKLSEQYKKTTQDMAVLERQTKMTESAKKAAANTLKVMGVAAVAVGASLIKNAFSVAAAGDAYAKQAAIIGTNAEELQKLNYVASIAGVEQGKLGDAMQKLNKNIGDARAGSGTLTTALQKTNPALLDQLKNTTDSAQAFDLLIGQIRNTTNAQDRAALAQAAFGKSGQALIGIANLSAEEIAKLRAEAEKYGIISNATAKESEAFRDSQTRMKAAIQGVKNSLGAALMPVIKSAIDSFTAFVGNGDKLKKLFQTLIPIVGALGGGLAAMFVVNKITSMVTSFKTTMLALKKVLIAHPILAMAAGLAALVAVFSSSGKSADDFEKEIQGAEGAVRNLQQATQTQAAAFQDFHKAIQGAGAGTAAYRQAVERLLDQTPELREYGITGASSLQEIEHAQRRLSEAMASKQIVEADKQYKVLADSLGDLRGKMTQAWEAYRSDPTQANLAAAKQYADQVQRSEKAMQTLGQQSGRSADEVRTAMDSAGTRVAGLRLGSEQAATAMQGIGKAALVSKKEIEDMVNKIFPLLDFLKKYQQQQQQAPQQRAAGPPVQMRDLSKEIQALADANEIKLSITDDYYQRRATLLMAAQRKEEELIAARDVSTAQRIRYVEEMRTKLATDLAALEIEQAKKVASEMKKIEEDKTKKAQEEHMKRMTFLQSMLETVSNIAGIIGQVNSARAAKDIATLEQQHAQEVAAVGMNNKRREELEKEHAKKKAKIEYDAAMKSWRLQVAAGVADGARAILSALLTKPFIPAGIAAAGVAAAMTGIQLSTLKAQKPTLSAETGGRFVVPENRASSRVDSQTMRVNPGEQIDVSPRGESRRATVVNVMLDRRTLWSAVQEGIDGGELTFTNANLVGA